MMARVHSMGYEAASFLSRKNLGADNGADIQLVDKERGAPDIGFGLDSFQEGYATSTVFAGGFERWKDAEKAAGVVVTQAQRRRRGSTFWTQPW